MLAEAAAGDRELPTWSTRRGPAAGIAVLASVSLVFLLIVTRRDVPVPSMAERAGAVLRAAADAMLGNIPLAPGRLRHVIVHEVAVDVVTDSGGGQVLEPDRTVSEQWIPADLRGEWRWRFYEEKPAGRVLLSDLSGRCGSFYDESRADPCRDAGTWQLPGPAFIEGLPGEPAAMLARLRADAADLEGDPDQGAWEYATTALETGILPPRAAAVVYRSLAGLPGVEVIRAPHRDDPVLVGRAEGGTRFAVVIDARTGTLLGHERRQVTGIDGIPAGTLLNTTRVETEIAGEPASPAERRPRDGAQGEAAWAPGCRRLREQPV